MALYFRCSDFRLASRIVTAFKALLRLSGSIGDVQQNMHAILFVQVFVVEYINYSVLYRFGTLLLSRGADLIGSMNEPIKMSEGNLNVLINAKDFSM